MLRLMNCRKCGDLRVRTCECGACTATIKGARPIVTGPARLFAIRWEDYDAVRPGKHRDSTEETLR